MSVVLAHDRTARKVIRIPRALAGERSRSVIALVNRTGSSRGALAMRWQRTRPKFQQANHLLGFHLAPRPASNPLSAPVPRRLRRRPVFSKERFLQANYRFLVSSAGDYNINLADPDQVIEWNLIDQISYNTPHTISCPICLDTPVAAKITKCGHIYCWPCILRYLSYVDSPNVEKRHWRRCPLCFEAVTANDLKSVVIEHVHPYAPGDTIKLVLLQRARGSAVPFRRENGSAVLAGACPSSSDADAGFARFTLSEDLSEAYGREARELAEARVAAENLADGSAPFVALALKHLQEREAEYRRRGKGPSELPAERPVPASSGAPPEQPPPRTESASSARSSPAVQRPVSASPALGAGRRHRSAFYDDDDLLDGDEEEEMEEEEPADEGDEGAAFEDPWGSDAGPLSPAAASAASWDALPPPLDLPEGAPGAGEGPATPSGASRAAAAAAAADPNFYYFYQAGDGQNLFLHPLCVKMLLHEYGSYAAFPGALEGSLLELERVTMSEELRRRHKYLAHLPLAADFTLCELDLATAVSPATLRAFAGELKQRWRRRMERERAEKRRAQQAQARAVAEKERLAAMLTTRRDEEHPPLLPPAPSPPLPVPAAEGAERAAPHSGSPGAGASVWGPRSGRDVVEGGFCGYFQRAPSSSAPVPAPAGGAWPAASVSPKQAPAGPSFSAVLRNQGAPAAPAPAPAGPAPGEQGGKKKGKKMMLLSNAGGRGAS
eukprot:tig00021493_g21870.t1